MKYKIWNTSPIFLRHSPLRAGPTSSGEWGLVGGGRLQGRQGPRQGLDKVQGPRQGVQGRGIADQEGAFEKHRDHQQRRTKPWKRRRSNPQWRRLARRKIGRQGSPKIVKLRNFCGLWKGVRPNTSLNPEDSDQAWVWRWIPLLAIVDVWCCLKKLALYFFDTQCVATRKYGGKLWPLLPTGDSDVNCYMSDIVFVLRKRRCKTEKEGGGEEMRRQFSNSWQGDLAQDHVEVDQGDRAGHHHPLGQLHARKPRHLESPS